MTGPTGLIFAMRSMYGTDRTMYIWQWIHSTTSRDTEFSAENAASDLEQNCTGAGSNPGLLNASGTYNTSTGMTTAESELWVMHLVTSSQK